MKAIPRQHVAIKRRTFVLIALGLALVTGAVYLPMLWQAFINYDDPGYVTDNPHVQQGLSLDSVRWAFTSSKQSNWHPLTWISLIIDYQLFDGQAWGFKLVNLLLHVVNTVLLFGVMRKMTGGLWSSAFVAALFGLHPVHVESVAWVAERKDVLSGLFWMLTMWGYVVYARRPTVGRYIVVLLCFAVGLLAKPMLVTLPCVLLLLDIWPLKRRLLNTKKQKPADQCFSQKTLPALVLEKIPLFVLVAISCVVTFIVQQRGGSVTSFEMYSLPVRLANTVIAYVSYLGKMFVPIRLAVFYPHPGTSISYFWALCCGVILAGITVVLLRQRRQRSWLAVGWLWYLGTLIPVIGLVQVGGQSMADRYTYIPLIGIFMLIAEEFRKRIEQGQLNRRAAAAAAAAVLLVLSGLTVRQVGFWKDSITLNQHAIDVTNNNWVAYSNVGIALNLKGDYQEAIGYLKRAIDHQQDSANDHYNIAYSYSQLGQKQQALTHYNEAIRLDGKNPLFYDKQGQILSELGRYEQAVAAYRRAIALDPKNAAYHHSLGLSLAQLNQIDSAIDHLQQAIEYNTNKNDPEYLTDLGNAYLMKNDTQNAIRYYQQALTQDSDYTSAQMNLTIALLITGRGEEAVRIAKEYVNSHPNSADAYYGLGNVLLNTGQNDAARAAFKKALRIQPGHTAAKQALGRCK